MKNMYNGPMWLKYALYGVLGWEINSVGASVPWAIGIVVTVLVIETLAVLQSKRD